MAMVLAKWPAYGKAGGYQVMHLDSQIKAAADATRGRYEALDAVVAARQARTTP